MDDDNSTIIFINGAEMDPDLKELLEQWEITEGLCMIFISFGITKLNHLRAMELSDIDELFGKISNDCFGEKLIFKSKLRKWRKEQQIPMMCDDDTASTTSNSRILEWLEKISNELSNQGSSSRGSTPNIRISNAASKETMDALLKSTIKEKNIVEYYAEHNSLNKKKQNDLAHCIVDSFVENKQKMCYSDMQQWAYLIEDYFPAEKSITYYLPRKKGARNPTGKLHSRWCNVVHPKQTAPLDSMGGLSSSEVENSEYSNEDCDDGN